MLSSTVDSKTNAAPGSATPSGDPPGSVPLLVPSKMGKAVPGSSATCSESNAEEHAGEPTTRVCPDSQWFYCTKQLLIRNWKKLILKLRFQGIQDKLLFIT